MSIDARWSGMPLMSDGPFDRRNSKTCSEEVVESGADQTGVRLRNSGDRIIDGLTPQRAIRSRGQGAGFREGGLEPRPDRTRFGCDVGAKTHGKLTTMQAGRPSLLSGPGGARLSSHPSSFTSVRSRNDEEVP
jgi:hypothetical protein